LLVGLGLGLLLLDWVGEPPWPGRVVVGLGSVGWTGSGDGVGDGKLPSGFSLPT
jgi:hypothetical protein